MPTFTSHTGRVYTTDGLPREGKRAQVWPCLDAIGRRVAVKRAPRTDSSGWLARERDALLQLSQNNDGWITPVLDHGETDGRPFVVVPWYEETLASWLQRGHTFEEQLEAATTMTAAVVALHQSTDQATAHGQVTPRQFMVRRGPDGLEVVLASTGLRAGQDKTNTSAIATDHYAPPDQLLGWQSTPASTWDVHAVAVSVFECLTRGFPAAARRAGTSWTAAGWSLLAAQRRGDTELLDKARTNGFAEHIRSNLLDPPLTDQELATLRNGSLRSLQGRVHDPEGVADVITALLQHELLTALRPNPTKRPDRADRLLKALRQALETTRTCLDAYRTGGPPPLLPAIEEEVYEATDPAILRPEPPAGEPTDLDVEDPVQPVAPPSSEPNPEAADTVVAEAPPDATDTVVAEAPPDPDSLIDAPPAPVIATSPPPRKSLAARAPTPHSLKAPEDPPTPIVALQRSSAPPALTPPEAFAPGPDSEAPEEDATTPPTAPGHRLLAPPVQVPEPPAPEPAPQAEGPPTDPGELPLPGRTPTPLPPRLDEGSADPPTDGADTEITEASTPVPLTRATTADVSRFVILGVAFLIIAAAIIAVLTLLTAGIVGTVHWTKPAVEPPQATGPTGPPLRLQISGTPAAGPVIADVDGQAVLVRDGTAQIPATADGADAMTLRGGLDDNDDGRCDRCCWTETIPLPQAGPDGVIDVTHTSSAVADCPSWTMGLGMNPIRAGHFTMGALEEDVLQREDESPVEVTLTRDLWVGSTEVPQQLWQEVMGSNPSKEEAYGTVADITAETVGATLPVQNVSWCDALRFANKLSERERLPPAYVVPDDCEDGVDVAWDQESTGYRLPTEAEWEYIARAGDPNLVFTGTGDPRRACRYGNIRDAAAASMFTSSQPSCEDGFAALAPVGSLEPNAWGLYDTTGNVKEWVWDRYDTFGMKPLTDPTGSRRGKYRVIRGGSWFDEPSTVRLARRHVGTQDQTSELVGVRLVRSHLED